LARIRLLPPNAYLGWTPYAWLIYLATFFVLPVKEHSVLHWQLSAAGTVVFLVSYFRGFWLRGRDLVPIILTQIALGLALTPVNAGAYVMFVYAASFAAQLERTSEALRWIGAIYVIGLLSAWSADVPAWCWVGHAVFTPFVSGVNLHFARMDRANARLRIARHEEIEHLAAVAERERIARDLHDVMGHTLSLIVLKAELASKLAEIDPARAVKEIRDVEQVARAALRGVREAIRGYRPTLSHELACARTLLDAAQIQADVDVQELAWTTAGEEVIALALREAVTNVVRHSHASHMRIRIWRGEEGSMLEVTDNGKGEQSAEGNGLRGMRERVEALGGRVSRAFGDGMRLTIALPVAVAS
jgi:two-component system sensor histidine kinase DesK